MEWLVVGGAVRDLLLGYPVRDLDVSFEGDSEDFLQVFPRARKAGQSLDIFLVGAAEFTALDGDREQDMLRRDLTINAAAVDAQGRFFCHPRFLDDLQAGILRLSSPEVLERDPLRLFRVARFAASFPDFELEGDSLERMRSFCLEHGDLLASIPRERVCHELLRALEAAQPSRFFTILRQCGGFQPWFAELAPAATVPAGPSPWHDNSVLEHTLEVMDRCAGHPLAVWMGLCHDLGKICTDPSILPHHYGHENRGVELARILGERLGVPGRYLRAGMVGTALHMKGGMYGTLRAGTRRDMLYRLRQARIGHDFWVLAGADGGWNWEPMARRDLEALDRVKLPEHWRDRGEESGIHLRLMQCEALSRLPQYKPERARNAPPLEMTARFGED